MYFRIILVAVFVVSMTIADEVAQNPAGHDPCGVNEEFLTCKKCDELCSGELRPCPKDCRPGCSCIKGYKRNCREKCVLPEHCSTKDCTCPDVPTS